MSGVEHIIARLAGRLAELERRVENMQRHGTVAEVDAATSRVRLITRKIIDAANYLVAACRPTQTIAYTSFVDGDEPSRTPMDCRRA